MTSKHTPGPWRATSSYGEDDSQPYLAWSDNRGAAISHVFRRSEAADGVGMEEQRANARLIAAAPELLEACEAIAGMNVTADTDHAQLAALCMGIAKTAITKATEN